MKNISKVASFLQGMKSIFIILPSETKDPFENTTDAQRLEKDWLSIGSDLKKSIELMEQGCEKYGRRSVSNHQTK